MAIISSSDFNPKPNRRPLFILGSERLGERCFFSPTLSFLKLSRVKKSLTYSNWDALISCLFRFISDLCFCCVPLRWTEIVDVPNEHGSCQMWLSYLFWTVCQWLQHFGGLGEVMSQYWQHEPSKVLNTICLRCIFRVLQESDWLLTPSVVQSRARSCLQLWVCKVSCIIKHLKLIMRQIKNLIKVPNSIKSTINLLLIVSYSHFELSLCCEPGVF